MDATLLMLACAYALASCACALAASRVATRRPSGAAARASGAYLGWWVAGATLTALQATEAALLAFGPMGPGLAVSLAILRAAAVSVALASLAYYHLHLLTGATRHALPLIVLALAFAAALFGFVVATPPALLASSRFIALLMVARFPNLALGLVIVLAPLVGMVGLGFAARSVPVRRQRLRGELVAGGVTAAALAMLGQTLVRGAAIETVGVAIAALAVFMAYARRDLSA